MPLIRPNKLPSPPELGEKTFWDYFPRRSARRVFFMLLALAAVLFLKRSGSWRFGGLMESPRHAASGEASGEAPGAEPAAPVYHIKVTPPPGAAPAAPAPPDSPASQRKP
jgi:hypothetical protein